MSSGSLRLMTFVVLSTCYFLIAGALVLSKSLTGVLGAWGSASEATVYLADDISFEQQQVVESVLATEKNVSQVEFQDQRQAMQILQKQILQLAPELVDDEGMFSLAPKSFVVKAEGLDGSARLAFFESLAQKFKSMNGVEEVAFGKSWLEKYEYYMSFFRAGLLLVGTVVGLAMLLVISNSIRSSVIQRRDKIEILELVGATPFMIRKPFVVEGFLISFFSAGLGMFVVEMSLAIVRDLIKDNLFLMGLVAHLQGLQLFDGALFLLAASGVGALGAYLAVSSLNSGWAAARRG